MLKGVTNQGSNTFDIDQLLINFIGRLNGFVTKRQNHIEDTYTLNIEPFLFYYLGVKHRGSMIFFIMGFEPCKAKSYFEQWVDLFELEEPLRTIVFDYNERCHGFDHLIDLLG